MNGTDKLAVTGRAGILRRLLWAGLLSILVIMAGCGGKGQETTGEVEENGEISIALTDAEGDFVSYTVDVISLTLTKANGTVVETLPLRTRVDFAQYTDMTEFLSIATIPSGVYVKGSMVLDYSNAEILVENAAGQPVRVAADAIRDKDNNVVTQMSMSVQLEGRNHLTIVPGVPAHLSLDFDLPQSNKVVFNEEAAEVTVEPYLLAEVNAESHKLHRVRGPLREVQVDANKFQVFIRPFVHHLGRQHRHFGVLNVETSDETYFEIDGETFQGQAGLTVLAEVATYSAVAVLGEIKHQPRRFIARQVYAGSGVPGGDMDVTRGSVVARNGDVLVVKGITFLRNSGAITFNDTVEVSIDESTTILKALNVGLVDKSAISVGQFVSVFGTLSGEPNARQLNAANGYARMELSFLRGTRVASLPEAPFEFVLNLSRINGRDVAQYDFSGTGLAEDADPSQYEINTGELDISGIENGSLIWARGHVTPFGEAPADFDAVTLIKRPESVIH